MGKFRPGQIQDRLRESENARSAKESTEGSSALMKYAPDTSWHGKRNVQLFLPVTSATTSDLLVFQSFSSSAS